MLSALESTCKYGILHLNLISSVSEDIKSNYRIPTGVKTARNTS